MSHHHAARRRTSLAAAVVLVALVAAGCTGESDPPPAGGSSASSSGEEGQTGPAPAAVTRAPDGVNVAGGESVTDLASSVSAALFEGAQVVVVAGSADATGAAAAAKAATSLGVPLLLTGASAATPTPDDTATTADPSAAPSPSEPALSAEVERLGAKAVLAVGDGAASLSLPDVEITTAGGTDDDVDRALGELPPTAGTTKLTDTTVLVRAASSRPTTPDTDAVAIVAATATAQAAGAVVVTSPTADPRATSDSVVALAKAPTASVVAVGAEFGAVPLLTNRLAVAATGVELPGGGQTLFPGRALVALYGHPSGGALGVLGEQGPEASVARAEKVAATYDDVYDVPVIATFEVIATVASGSAGKDGDYSNEWSVESLTPYVDAATEAGMYVVLDLQPGRADLVEQAKRYASLLVRPNVGLAIDPEWALTSSQKPLQQIGSVSAAQINEVVTWLADLTASETLPQKLLVLHQFRTAMIRDEQSIDLSRDELAVLIHADGQGGRSAKEGTWNALVAAAPSGVHFGWKNFYDEDPQLATPAQSVQRTPVPLMISYQ